MVWLSNDVLSYNVSANCLSCLVSNTVCNSDDLLSMSTTSMVTQLSMLQGAGSWTHTIQYNIMVMRRVGGRRGVLLRLFMSCREDAHCWNVKHPCLPPQPLPLPLPLGQHLVPITLCRSFCLPSSSSSSSTFAPVPISSPSHYIVRTLLLPACSPVESKNLKLLSLLMT